MPGEFETRWRPPYPDVALAARACPALLGPLEFLALLGCLSVLGFPGHSGFPGCSKAQAQDPATHEETTAGKTTRGNATPEQATRDEAKAAPAEPPSPGDPRPGGSESPKPVLSAAERLALDAKWRLIALGRVAARPEGERKEYAELDELRKKSQALEAKGGYAAAQSVREKILEVCLRVLGEEHPETATSYEKLGEVLYARAAYAKSQQSYEKALALFSKLLGEEHPTTVATFDNLAVVLAGSGKYPEALRLAEKALAIRRRLFGEEHRETAGSYNNVAANLNAQGKYAEAQPLFEKALEISKRVLGEEHANTAVIHISTAANLRDLGRFAEAQPLYEKGLALSRKVLGEEHPTTVVAQAHVATNLRNLARYAEAQPACEKALALSKKVYGEDHPHTVFAYGILASNLTEQGRFAEAQPLYEKAHEINRRILGEGHPETARTCTQVAAGLQDLGRYAEAQPLYEEALRVCRNALGELHPHTARSYSNLAANLRAQARHAEAQVHFERSLALSRRILGDEHPSTASSLSNLATNLDDQGKHAEAQPLYEMALSVTRRFLGEEHPDMALRYRNLGANLQAQGKYPEARVCFEKALALSTKLLGEEHPDTATSLEQLARVLVAVSDNAGAQALYEKALAVEEKRLGAEHPDTAATCQNLATTLDAQGKHAEAAPLFARALAVFRKALGDDHPHTASAYGRIASNLNAQGKYAEALESWVAAAGIHERVRPWIASSGVERSVIAGRESPLPQLAAVLARLGRPAEAWRRWESGLARGLLDDLSAREARRLSEADRRRQQELTSQLASIEAALSKVLKLNPATPGSPASQDSPASARKLDSLRQTYLEVQAELSAFEKNLAETYGPAEGKTYSLDRIQKVLPEDAAIVGWLDIPGDPHAQDPGGEHWGVVVRSKGGPRWVRLPVAREGEWGAEGDALEDRLAAALADRGRLPERIPEDLVREVAAQRIAPLEPLLRSGEELPEVRRLVVLPSPALRGVPITVLAETYTTSYCPSATVLAFLREERGEGKAAKPRAARALVLGDPLLSQPSEGKAPPEPPDPPEHGALLVLVVPGSNAERSGLRPGDVLLEYAGERLGAPSDLPAALGKASGGGSVRVKVWREGSGLDLAVEPGKLGVQLDPRPARAAVLAEREFAKLVRGTRERTSSFPPLPGTRAEVAAVAASLEARGIEVDRLLGAEASESHLKQLLGTGMLSAYRYLHFATHGVPSLDRAFDSALILSAEDAEDLDDLDKGRAGRPGDPVDAALKGRVVTDGRLTAAEILRTWNLDADLVVLSACQTAVGRHAAGEGYLGFTQALLLSGARSVVLSLWKVDDTATSLLMRRFYENLLGGAGRGRPAAGSRAEALREAQRWLRELGGKDLAEAVAGLPRGTGGLAPMPASATQAAKVASAAQAGSASPAASGNPAAPGPASSAAASSGAREKPYADPYYWAAFILVGDPE